MTVANLRQQYYVQRYLYNYLEELKLRRVESRLKRVL